MNNITKVKVIPYCKFTYITYLDVMRVAITCTFSANSEFFIINCIFDKLFVKIPFSLLKKAELRTVKESFSNLKYSPFLAVPK
jgi:hypothetical protein